MKFITVEEHFVSPGFLAGPGRRFQEQALPAVDFLGGPSLLEGLRDVGEARIRQMDAAGIDVQVLSLNAPGVEQSAPDEAVAVAAESNDFLRNAVAANPTRFAALAALPMAAPETAARELEKRVVEQSFKGAIINGHVRGRYLDDRFFDPVLARAEALGVPLYLHPTLPPKPVIDALYSGLPPAASFLFAGPAWGWHIETAVHVLRMVLGGVFDRYPKLQVVIGHMGEGLPFMLPRLNDFLPKEATKLERRVAEYLRQNVHYTFGGFNYMSTFLNLAMEVGFDRIMLSVDYPYTSMALGRAFLEGLPASPTDKERMASRNAAALFRI